MGQPEKWIGQKWIGQKMVWLKNGLARKMDWPKKWIGQKMDWPEKWIGQKMDWPKKSIWQSHNLTNCMSTKIFIEAMAGISKNMQNCKGHCKVFYKCQPGLL
jgi:hypothetical protein